MKKICVTSVVSLLIAFVLVFAGCEQPVTAGLNNGGSVAVEETGAAGEDNTSGEVTSGEDSTTVVEVETGDGDVSVEVDTGDASVEVDTGDGQGSAIVVVDPVYPPNVTVEIIREIIIVDEKGQEGPFEINDYGDRPQLTLKAVWKDEPTDVVTDAVWSTDSPDYSLQDNKDGTCTLTGILGGKKYWYRNTSSLSVSSEIGHSNTTCEINYFSTVNPNDSFIDE